MTSTATPPPLDALPASDATPGGVIGDLHRMLTRAGVRCEITTSTGTTIQVGVPPAEFRLRFNTPRPFGRGLNERGIAESYLEDEFDIGGDVMRAFDIRQQLVDRVPVGEFLKVWLGHFLRPRTTVNKRAIAGHYNLGDEFYLALVDSRYRLYSHGIFERDDVSLEDAVERKLGQAYEALGLKAGMRILDIGAGWGAAEQYFGSRGVHVTGLTIAEDSRAFVTRLIERERLTANVRLEDFLFHRPAEPYDAIVIFGVIEHIPNYRRFARRVWELLKPGGGLYLDASASREKYAVSSFAREYIWPGSHTYLCLQDLMRELIYHGLEVLEVRNERHDYEITMMRWAERFDAAREFIVSRWGERTWRAWRLYLWGGAHAFRTDTLQAYHVVARRGYGRGPRPGWMKRGALALKSAV